MIIGKSSFNQPGASLSTLYLCIKYPFLDGWVEVFWGDQKIARKWYLEWLKLKKFRTINVNTVSMRLEAKLLKEALMDEDLAIIDQEDM